MMDSQGKTVVVTGATGLQGSAVTRHLLNAGWQVRALTRNPNSSKAKALAVGGAAVVQGNMDDPAALRAAFEGAYGVYSVQNPYPSGPDAEVRQGKNVADAARQVGVQHVVYGSAGLGLKGTGVPSWETKLQVEEYMHGLGLALTILRPTAFMELMTDKKFFPAAAAWHLMPRLAGGSTKLPWFCTNDLGAIAALAFAQPDRFVGQDLKLASDSQALDECRRIYREVLGKSPPRFPMPVWLFQRFGFVGKDLTTMWRWLGSHPIDVDMELTRAVLPEALTVRAWLRQQR